MNFIATHIPTQILHTILVFLIASKWNQYTGFVLKRNHKKLIMFSKLKYIDKAKIKTRVSWICVFIEARYMLNEVCLFREKNMKKTSQVTLLFLNDRHLKFVLHKWNNYIFKKKIRQTTCTPKRHNFLWDNNIFPNKNKQL